MAATQQHINTLVVMQPENGSHRRVFVLTAIEGEMSRVQRDRSGGAGWVSTADLIPLTREELRSSEVYVPHSLIAEALNLTMGVGGEPVTVRQALGMLLIGLPALAAPDAAEDTER